MFHIVRYLPSIGCFDVYLQNNYETYSIEGQSKARGSILYGPKDFLADFGVSLRCSYSKNKLFAYLEIIAKKYVLMTFEAPLTEADHDAYVENAILEFPITENCFRTRVYFSGDYCKAITVSLLAVNN